MCCPLYLNRYHFGEPDVKLDQQQQAVPELCVLCVCVQLPNVSANIASLTAFLATNVSGTSQSVR